MTTSGNDKTAATRYPRRVVTGHDERGTSVVLSDGPPPNGSRNCHSRSS
jgi:hypothetical protein